jgi:replicative DNA helicase
MMPSLDVGLDRPLPQNPEAERAVLGSILMNPTAYERVAGIVKEDDFYRDAHRTIFRAFAAVVAYRGESPDHLALRAELTRNNELEGIGGAAYVASLIDGIPDIANVERYARMVRSKADLRRIALAAVELARRALDQQDEPDAVAADAIASLETIGSSDDSAAVVDLRALRPELERMYEAGGLPRGERTGFATLDPYYTVAPGQFTLITGIPGHGKSGFLDAVAVNLARQRGWNFVVFSAENYPAHAHIATLAEKISGKPFRMYPGQRAMPMEIPEALAVIENHFTFINPETEGMTLDRILSISSRLATSARLDALIVDPWNEVEQARPDGLTETEYVSRCLSKIRRFARRHRMHVFVVAHPAKMTKLQTGERAGQYPVPSPYDISGSAHWRNKADACITVWRDISRGDEPQVQIHIQKIRRREVGRIGMVTLHFDAATGTYHDMEEPS